MKKITEEKVWSDTEQGVRRWFTTAITSKRLSEKIRALENALPAPSWPDITEGPGLSMLPNVYLTRTPAS